MDTITDTTATTAPVPTKFPVIRPERIDGSDIGAIRALIGEAFADAAHASGTEARIVDALRDAGALSYSLVAVHAGRIVGHAAASLVTLDPPDGGQWYSIGPVSVHPDFRRQGTGAAMMRALLDLIVVYGATGVVLHGDPALYSQFGFSAHGEMTLAGLPENEASSFQVLRLDGARTYPTATVTYHPAFEV